MKYSVFVFAALLAMGSTPARSSEPEPNAPSLECGIGPVHKIYGKLPWLGYSCSDARTFVILPAPGNPVSSAYFAFSPKGESYELLSKGAGSKDNMGDAEDAYKELMKLPPGEIEALVEETRKH